ncbi:RHS repeat domain-containing protein [Limisphaera sp. 4302-co]|uniref:RHS repeat domain-containing protein n=1 Tax=Limisphaera sp. 4302-co TaxID=3400417 RepID=UPI003C1D0B15
MWRRVESRLSPHAGELNATNGSPVQAYICGLDVSKTVDGAGGVGGLLWVRAGTGPASSTHFVCYDGNGNVWNLVSATTGTETARYEYGPSGEPLRLSGPAVWLNPFRFSTKRSEDFTGLVLYEYRAYNPTLGRWLSRDPIEERGGLGLLVLAGNASVVRIDFLGLDARAPNRPGPTGKQVTACVMRCSVEVGLVDWIRKKLDAVDFCSKLRGWCWDQAAAPHESDRVPEVKEWVSEDIAAKSGSKWVRFGACLSQCLGGPNYEDVSMLVGTGKLRCDFVRRTVFVDVPILVGGVLGWEDFSFPFEAQLIMHRFECKLLFGDCCACRRE